MKSRLIFEDLGIQVKIMILKKWVGECDKLMYKNIVDEMDVEASLASTHNRRTINMQIDTNEPGALSDITEK